MVCIYCKSKTEIINSRHLSRSNATWRRRHCLNCQAIMTTFEGADYSHLWVVASSETSHRPFVRDKLFLSIYDSLRHRKEAVNEAGSLTTTIIAKLAKNCPEGRISQQTLVSTAIECLKRFDKAAAVYYKAYYAK